MKSLIIGFIGGFGIGLVGAAFGWPFLGVLGLVITWAVTMAALLPR